MKLRFLILIIFLAVGAPPGLPQQASPPLTKDQVMDLVKFGMDGAELAKRINERGISFEVSQDYAEALHQAGAQNVVVQALVATSAFAQLSGPALTMGQVMKLVKFGMDGAEAAKRINERGISFEVSEDYIDSLRSAGAKDEVIRVLLTRSAFAQEAGPPLTQDQVMDLVKFGMDGEEVAKRIKERGIDFEPSDDYIEAVRKAGVQESVIQALREAKPLTREQIGKLVAGGVPSQRATDLVKQRGIDFQPDVQFLDTLRLAGADDALVAALREAGSAAWGELIVATSPNAEVYLDGAPQGRADGQGALTIKAARGNHILKVSLKGKKDFERNVTVVGRQTTKIEAHLVEITGELLLGTVPEADVYLDGVFRGRTDASGELSIRVAFGSHLLRIARPGKEDISRSVDVLQESTFVIAN